MQRRSVLAFLGLLVASTLQAASGCTDWANECRLNAECCPDGTMKCLCSGDPGEKNVIDECGVFVQADASAGGDGTRAKPFPTLANALAEAQSSGKRVYACAGAAFSEAVTISADVEVYGGFDCAAGWTWSPDARAVLNGPADAVALTITKAAEGAKVEGFTITAASPSAMTMSGGSSIAIAVDDVAVTIERCDVVASDAADGANGQTPTDPVTKAGEAAAPTDMTGATAACFTAGGGTPGMSMCADGMTIGGTGGKGGSPGSNNGYGEKGKNGLPLSASPPVGADGSGGDGQSNLYGVCAKGDPGAPGAAGSAGPGGSVLGDVLSLSGLSNTDTTNGQPGKKGQGGGGGGGAMAGQFCQAGMDVASGPGASGGGGGAGGCGGKGGGAGKAGGSSIAILSLGIKLVLRDVTLAVGKAGNGGKGAPGQGGSVGGKGANGGASSGMSLSKAGCAGGNGGTGGKGGPGGGGRGGHALGVAFAKTPSTALTVKAFHSGAGGDGGGDGAFGDNSGEPGKSGLCWDFASHMPCSQ